MLFRNTLKETALDFEFYGAPGGRLACEAGGTVNVPDHHAWAIPLIGLPLIPESEASADAEPEKKPAKGK